MPTKNLYFHCGGFYSMPHFIGAIKELRRQKHTNYIYYGNSSGASWAVVCYLILNGFVTPDHIKNAMRKVFAKSRPISPIMTPIYCDLIDVMTPYWPSDLAERLSGILHVGVSISTGHKFINKFATNAELYNALLCSGTIALFSDYVSLIDDEVCLDGGYTFEEHMLPKNTIIIASDIRLPLSMTTPPLSIYPILEENGRRNVVHGLEKPIIIHVWKPIVLESWFLLHNCTPKNLKWASHIANITQSRI